MTQIQIDAPAVISFSENEMSSEREARLLEAGAYPDKGLTLTEGDLDEIVARFSANGAPVKVEHVDSPLDPLGHVKRLWRDGKTLFGMLAFPDDLAGFLRRRGVQKLSVGLAREPLRLAEVSLVLKPRIGSAVLMSDPKDAEIMRLRAELVQQEVGRTLDTLKAQGRVVPATEALARALLSVPESALVTLSEGDAPEPVAALFQRFLAAQPPVVSFAETVVGSSEAEQLSFTQYEHTFLKETLGVDPAKVAETLREQAKG